MLSRKILENNFKEASIINTAFPYLTIEDSLSAALVLLESEGLNRVVVVDQDNHLLGLLDKSAVLGEFPPPNHLIPQNLTSQNKYLTRKACESIRLNSCETLDNVRFLIRRVESFKENIFIVHAVRYLLSGNIHLTDDLIVLTDENSLVLGTVSGKDLINYLAKYMRPEVSEQDIQFLAKQTSLINCPVKFQSSEPLKKGFHIMNYTPATCILLERNDKIVGFLSREMISQQVHRLYPEFLQYPMENFMRSLDALTILSRSEINILTLQTALLNTPEEMIFISDRSRKRRISEQKNSRGSNQIVTVKALLALVFQKLLVHP